MLNSIPFMKPHIEKSAQKKFKSLNKISAIQLI